MSCSNEFHPLSAVKNADAQCHIVVSLLSLLAARAYSTCDYTSTHFLQDAAFAALDQECPEAWVDKLIFKDAPYLLQYE